MIRTLLWKECREQRLIWLAFVILALGGVIGIQMTLTMPDFYVAAIQMCYPVSAYGLVCGAMMLAGERESKTLPFLDSLGATRSRLWMTKFFAGAALAFFYCAVVSLILFIPSGVQTRLRIYYFALHLLLCWEALAWGLFFSALTRRVFVGVLAGMGVLASIWFATAFFEHGQFFGRSFPIDKPVVLRAVMGIGALACSWSRFAKWDLNREVLNQVYRGCMRLAWLTFKQARIAAPAFWLTAMLVGFLVEPRGLLFSPMTTLILGVSCGIAVYAGDQRDGAHRFLGAQRYPIGRIWLVKTLLWTLVALFSAELLGRGSGYEFFGATTDSGLWLVYGFCAGQLFSLLMRQTLIAAIYAILVSMVLVAFWIPSQVCGGLHLWQWCLPPLVLLAATRLSLRACVNDRLYTFLSARVLVTCSALAISCLAGGLWYRVGEVPDERVTLDIKAFEASLPTPGQNEAGRLILEAMDEFLQATKQANIRLGMFEPNSVSESHLHFLLENRRPDKDWTEPWLDWASEGNWRTTLQKAAAKPLGTLAVLEKKFSWKQPVLAADVLALRATRWQVLGKYESALDNLALVLNLSLNLRNKATYLSYQAGLADEERALLALEDLLEKSKAPVKDLRRTLELLNQHVSEIPALADMVKVEYLLHRRHFMEPLKRKDQDSLVIFSARGFAEHVPWEAARRERIVALFFASWLRFVSPQSQANTSPIQYGTMAIQKGPPPVRIPSPVTRSSSDRTELSQESLRQLQELLATEATDLLVDLPIWEGLPKSAAEQMRHLNQIRIQVAAALLYAEHGMRARQMSDLVPRYLSTVPLDPVTGTELPLNSGIK